MTTAALSANGGHPLEVPPIHCLVDAAQAQHLMLVSFWFLEHILAHYVEESEGYRPGQERHQSILLKLIFKYWSVTLTLWSESQPLLSVGDGDVEAGAGCSDAHRRDTEPTGEQSLGNLEESLVQSLNS